MALALIIYSILDSVKFWEINKENYHICIRSQGMNEFQTVGEHTLRPLARGPNCIVTLELGNALINIARDKLRINECLHPYLSRRRRK